jgi:cellobiose phosphorylase
VLRIRNAGTGVRRLRTFSYAEFGYVDGLSDQQNLDWSQHIVTSRLEGSAILASTRFRPTTTFFAASEPPSGWTGDREAFVGRCRDLASPVVVETGEPTNAGSPRGNSIGSLCHDVSLGPGEERRLVFMLGLTDHPEEIGAVIARYRDEAAVEGAFDELRADWRAYLGRFTVTTPDPEMTEMLNVWNQVQCRTTLNWSRFVSGYETGLGRGMGTRDSAQDTLGTMHSLPGQARRTLTRTWSLQFRDGHAWHQIFPLSGEGGPGLAAEFPGWPQWFSDDHLWLVLATCAYLRETGDLAYLDERAPWADGDAGTIRAHMQRAVAFTLANRGPHGLPRAGFADWDDTLNVDHGSGKAESVWCAMQFCRVVLDLADLSRHLGRSDEAARCADLHREMAACVNDVGWDGSWYARAFDNDGRPIGVASETVHRINLNPQTWSIIGEVAPPERAARALDAVTALLETPFGTALLWPPYDGGDDRVRGTSTYPPGAKENGGIFCHANTWLIIAAAMLGRADDACAHYRRILPPGANRFRRVPGRAVRVLPEHLRSGASPVRDGPQRLADGDCGVGIRCRDPVDPGDPPDVRGAADRAGDPGSVARVRGAARVPGRDPRDPGSPRRPRARGLPCGGRAASAGIRRPAAAAWHEARDGRRHPALSGEGRRRFRPVGPRRCATARRPYRSPADGPLLRAPGAPPVTHRRRPRRCSGLIRVGRW